MNIDWRQWFIDVSVKVVGGCIVSAAVGLITGTLVIGCISAMVMQNKQQMNQIEKKIAPIVKKAEAAKAKGGSGE
jgi:hypothetical protein